MSASKNAFEVLRRDEAAPGVGEQEDPDERAAKVDAAAGRDPARMRYRSPATGMLRPRPAACTGSHYSCLHALMLSHHITKRLPC